MLFYDLNNHKSSKTIPEWGLDTELIGDDTFLEFQKNDMINKGFIQIVRELDSLNSSNINNENIPHINVLDVPKENNLSHQQCSGILIKELKNTIDLRQIQYSIDQLEIMDFNKNILIDFDSNTEQLKNKKIRTFSSICTYTYNKEIVSCLYSYLLKTQIKTMGNLSLLNILISEIEYNNEVMIYCFLASRICKILNFIIGNFYTLDINPIFFYNVGIFMEKYCTHGFSGGCSPIERRTNALSKKYKALSGFIKAYKVLEVHNEMNIPDIFDENNVERQGKIQSKIITLYNLVKEQYKQYYS